MSEAHPYTSFELHPAWKVVQRALNDLEENSDLELQTAERYVVGYLLKSLQESGMLLPFAPGAIPSHGLNESGVYAVVYYVPAPSREKATEKR